MDQMQWSEDEIRANLASHNLAAIHNEALAEFESGKLREFKTPDQLMKFLEIGCESTRKD